MKYKETWVQGSGNQEKLWIHCWHNTDPANSIRSSQVCESPTIWIWIWTKLSIHIFNWINPAIAWRQRGKWSSTYYRCWLNQALNLRHSCETQSSSTSSSSKDIEEVVSIFRPLFLTSHSKRSPASYRHFWRWPMTCNELGSSSVASSPTTKNWAEWFRPWFLFLAKSWIGSTRKSMISSK